MVDNSIITKYKDKFSNDGVLDLDKTDFIKKENGNITTINDKLLRLDCDLGSYLLYSVSKEYCDAQIFFSQYYSKFGLTTPVYFMVRKCGIDYLACNVMIKNKGSLENYLNLDRQGLPSFAYSDEDILARDFNKVCSHLVSDDSMPNYEKLKYYFSAKKEDRKGFSFDKKNRIMSSLFLKNNTEYISLFSTNAVVEKIKMGLLDTTLLNSSRNSTNYVYKTKMKNDDIQVSSIIPLNCGNSAYNVFSRVYRRKDTPYSKRFPFDTVYSPTTVEKIVNDVKTDFKLNTYFSRGSRIILAQDFDKITDKDIADEVKENIGYSLNKFYQDEVYLRAKDLSRDLRSGICNLCL